MQLQHYRNTHTGVQVRNREVQIEEEKVKAIKEWKTPTKVKDVESFLGFANFY